jgi:hypothetical protein
LPLPEEQAKSNIDANQRQAQGGRQDAKEPASAGQWLLRGQGAFPSGRRCVLAELRHDLAEGEFVGGFERGSTDAAKDCGAIAANQRITNGLGARRAPQICR